MNASVSEMAHVLLQTALGPDELEEVILDDLEADFGRELVRLELICLRAFALEWTVSWMLEVDREGKDKLLAAYRGLWEDNPERKSLHGQLESRREDYDEAVGTAEEQAEGMGGVFASLCGCPGNEKLVLAGSAMFAALIEGAGSLLATWKPVGK